MKKEEERKGREVRKKKIENMMGGKDKRKERMMNE